MKSDDEYFKDEEFIELLNQYEQSVSSGQPVFIDADDLADIADYYNQNDRYDDAQQAMELVLELQPDSIVALNYQKRIIAETFGNAVFLQILIKPVRQIDLTVKTAGDRLSTFEILRRCFEQIR